MWIKDISLNLSLMDIVEIIREEKKRKKDMRF